MRPSLSGGGRFLNARWNIGEDTAVTAPREAALTPRPPDAATGAHVRDACSGGRMRRHVTTRNVTA